ncbi:MAG: hypothetical protein WC100_00930 [Sterolibacterium sp.]
MQVGQVGIEFVAGLTKFQQDVINAQRQVEQSTSRMGAAADLATKALGALGIGLSAAAFVNLIKGSIDAADHLNDLHKSTGILAGDLAGLRLLAKQTGTDMDGLAGGILKMSVAIGKDPEKFKALGVTAKDNTGAFKQLADIFNLIPDIQQRNALSNAVFGKSWKEMAPALSEGSQKIGETIEKGKRLSGITEEMTKASDEFNDKWAELTQTGGFLTRQVAPLLPLMNALADDMLEAQGKSIGLTGEFHPMAEAFRAAVILGGNVAFVLKAMGTEAGGLAAQLAALARGDLAGFKVIGVAMKKDAEDARAAFDIWEQKMLTVGTTATETKTEVVGATGEMTAAQKEAAKRAAEFLKQQDDAANELINTYNSLVDRVNEHNVQMTLEERYGRTLTEAEKIEITVKEKLGALAQQDLKDAVAWGVAKETELKLRKEYIKAIDDENKALAASEAGAMKAFAEAQQASIKSYGALIDKLEEETATMLMSSGEREKYIALKKLDREYTVGIIATEEEYLARVKEITAAMNKRDEQQKTLDMMKEQAGMWTSINDVAKSTFVSIFQSGKSAFDRLKDTLKNGLYALLYEMTIKKWIINIAAGVSGTGVAAQAFGSSAVGGAAGSAAASAAGSSMFGTAISSGFATMAGEVGTWMGGAGNALVGVLADAGITSTTLLSVAQVVPVVGVVVAGLYALSSILGSGGGPKVGGSASLTGSTASVGGGLWGMQTEHQTDAQFATLLQTFKSGMEDTITKLGGSVDSAMKIAIGLSADPAGTAPDFTFASLKSGSGQTLYDRVNTNVARGGGSTELGVEMQRMLLAALQAADLAPWAAQMVAGLNPVSLTAEQLTKVFTDLNTAMAAIQTAEAARKQTLFSLMSDTEKLALAQKELADAGIPNTLAGYKAMLQGLDLTTEAGQKTLGTMIGLKGSFDFIQQYVPPATEAVTEVATAIDTVAVASRSLASIEQERVSLQDQWNQLTLTNAQLLALQREKIDASNLALFDNIQLKIEENKTDAAAVEILKTKLSWQNQLDILTGKTTQTQLDRAAALASTTDTATQDIMRLVFTAQDLKVSTDAAAESAKTLAAQQAAIANERRSLQDQLDNLTMTSAQLLQKQRNSISASNRDIFDQIQTVTAQSAANAERIQENIARAEAFNKKLADETKARQDLITNLQSTINTMDGFTASLEKFRNALGLGNLSTLSAADKYVQARAAFQAANTAAGIGNADALNGGLQSAITDFLTASKAASPTLLAYRRDEAAAMRALASAIQYTSGMAAMAQDQLVALPSHATGLDYVPYDGYRAQLHKGERVQTQAQASSSDQMTKEMGEIRKELAETKRDNRYLRDLFEKWEGSGMPPARTAL